MLKLYLNFLIFCMVISPSGLDIPIHASGPLAWIGKSKALGALLTFSRFEYFCQMNAKIK